jgi:glycosyltransferase involved in cell wall biosynthesis
MFDPQTDPPPNILKGHQWVVFGPDWGRHPSVSQHLFSQFLGASSVLWVETVGLRAPALTWRDVFRSIQKITDFLTCRRARACPAPGLTILSPPTLPFTRWRWVRRLNLWHVRRQVRATLKKLGFNQPKLVVTVPSQCDFVGQLGEVLSLYYCIDDYALWKGMNPKHVRQMEAELVQQVDAIVVPSDFLEQRMLPTGKPVLVLTHGVDLTHFRPAAPRPDGLPFEMVYFGMIDNRLDQDLLASLAQALPEARIRLIGPVTLSVTRLSGIPNIHLEGPVPYEKLPEAISSASVFLLPFVFDALSQSCSPIKIKEYLACGRPVVATAIPEVSQFEEFVMAVSSPEDFVQAVLSIRSSSPAPKETSARDLLVHDSWRCKAMTLSDATSQWLSAKTSQIP